jgi:hypothetical protein
VDAAVQKYAIGGGTAVPHQVTAVRVGRALRKVPIAAIQVHATVAAVVVLPGGTAVAHQTQRSAPAVTGTLGGGVCRTIHIVIVMVTAKQINPAAATIDRGCGGAAISR